MRYDAFISYRHSPLDMEIAKKVHTALETYRVPKSVKAKIEKKKITRVFRDSQRKQPKRLQRGSPFFI